MSDDGSTRDLTSRERSTANLIPGRKSLSGEIGKHSPVVNVRVPDHTRDGLRQVADKGGQTITKVARQALQDAQEYFVLFEQSFDGAGWEWVRFDKALSLSQAEQFFETFKRLAPTHGYRCVQIRHGRDYVVQQWPPA